MRDRRDYVIAVLAAALLFCVGVFAGRQASVVPAAQAQDQGFDPTAPVGQAPPGSAQGTGGGVTIPGGSPLGSRFSGRTMAPTSSDSNANNRFVAVTCPVGSGESVLFLIDSQSEQVACYTYQRYKGLSFLAGRNIEYDLKVNGYQDISELTHEEMRNLYEKQIAKQAAQAAKQK